MKLIKRALRSVLIALEVLVLFLIMMLGVMWLLADLSPNFFARWFY